MKSINHVNIWLFRKCTSLNQYSHKSKYDSTIKHKSLWISTRKTAIALIQHRYLIAFAPDPRVNTGLTRFRARHPLSGRQNNQSKYALPAFRAYKYSRWKNVHRNNIRTKKNIITKLQSSTRTSSFRPLCTFAYSALSGLRLVYFAWTFFVHISWWRCVSRVLYTIRVSGFCNTKRGGS